jgi:hypothetical protein
MPEIKLLHKRKYICEGCGNGERCEVIIIEEGVASEPVGCLCSDHYVEGVIWKRENEELHKGLHEIADEFTVRTVKEK